MKIQLNSCSAIRPNKRALESMLMEIADNMDQYTATDYIDILLAGDPVEIEVSANPSSAYRALRKLDVDYDLLD